MRGSLVLIGWFSVATIAACERPVPEPAPRRASASGSQQSAAPGPTAGADRSGTQTVSPTAPPPVEKAKCVVPLPDQPERPLVPGPDPRCPADPDGRPNLKTAVLRFERSGARVTAELATLHDHRMRGLMYRTEMGEDEGMLFVFERPRRNRFWMRNTCLPLDMLFVDKHGFIVGIEENVPTMNDENYFVRCASQYVIEVNAGWSRRHGVRPGDRVELPS